MSIILPANTAWYTFTSFQSHFSVLSFSGMEKICRPFEFSIELVSHSANENITGLIGTEALLAIADGSIAMRYVHGCIRDMEQLHTANRYTHYRCSLVPRLWFLDKIRDHRIFQHLSVAEIITRILHEQGFPQESFTFNLFYSYEPREYCVQYGETDLHFISRLCEEEGIYFYFEHSANSHTLCFCDREGGPTIKGGRELRFYRGSGTVSDVPVISNVVLHEKILSNSVAYREWNFTKPKLDLEITKAEPDKVLAPTPKSMNLEQYRFPHLYQLQKAGNHYGNIQLLRQLAFSRSIECESDIARFMPASTFAIHEHHRSDINSEWWVYSVSHEGEQPGVLQHEAPSDSVRRYTSVVQAIPATTRFIPALDHPKNTIEGVQSAIVTGPQGEEIYVDEYGRVKVQFHWDRLGARDENTTCWVRVADFWAGEDFGSIQPPRIGQEVLVEYMEGDPDRPVITGRAYNRLRMPPWDLPSQKALSGIQSREIGAGRRNQLVFDDTQGAIQTQLASDHNASQLNLGYITRINHREGRKDFRGEGFELRTDGWGVLRASKGMYIGTETRNGAQGHHKDMSEAINNLHSATSQHAEMTNLAEVYRAHTNETDGDSVAKALHAQTSDIRGSGGPHEELAKPHIVLSSPAGIAVTTPNTTHLHSMENTALTAGKHISFSAGRSFFASALERVSLFAHKLGMRLISGHGKIEIQAQTDGIDVLADKVLRIISAKETVAITAAEEILLTGGGSFIRINKSGITEGTMGDFTVHARSRKMTGPDSMEVPIPSLPSGAVQFNEKFVVIDEFTGEALANVKYELIFSDGSIVTGITGKDGMIPLQERLDPAKVTINLFALQE